MPEVAPMTGNWRMAPLSLALFATVCAGADPAKPSTSALE